MGSRTSQTLFWLPTQSFGEERLRDEPKERRLNDGGDLISIQLLRRRLPKKIVKASDNAKRYSGKYPINFEDSELLLKFIVYFPDYFSAFS